MTGRRILPEDLSGPTDRWTVTVALSLVLHVGGFILAITLPRLLGHGAQGPPVYVVDLVSLPAPGGPGAPPPAAGAAAPKKQEITRPPQPEKVIKVPDRRFNAAETKKKPPAPKKAETKPTPAPSPKAAGSKGEAAGESRTEPAPGAAPGARGGTAAAGAPGGGGTGTGGGSNFYFTYLHGKIESAWQKPIYPPAESARRILTATVRLTLSSSGRVIRLDLVSSSGYEALDQSVLRAVQDAQPFNPIPTELGGDALTVNLAFDLTPD